MRSPTDAVGIGKFLPPPQGEGDHEVVVGVSHRLCSYSPSRLTPTAPSQRGPRYAALRRRDVEDAVPYDFTKMPTESVGAGLPDGPPMPNGIGKTAAVRRRDVEDAVPYDFTKMPTESVGAGLPDGPPMPNGIGKTAAVRRRDVEDAVPYGFTKMCKQIRRGDSRIARRCRKDCA